MRGLQTAPKAVPAPHRLSAGARLAISLAPRTLRHTGGEAEAARRTLAEVEAAARTLRSASAAQLAARVAGTEAAALARYCA